MPSAAPYLYGNLKMEPQQPKLLIDLATLEEYARNVERSIPFLEKMGLRDLCLKQYDLEYTFKQVEDLTKRLSKVNELIKKALLPKAFEEAGTDMFRIPEIARSFSPATKMSVTIKGEDKSGGMEWLRGNGFEDIIKPTVNASALSSAAKELLEEQGIDLPDDLFNVTTYKVVTHRKYTPKD